MDLKTLCQLQGLSGREEIIRKIIFDICVDKFGKQNVSFDGLGSVIAVKHGTSTSLPHIMLAAHMDEVGLMVVSATDDGMLKFRAIGGIDSRVLVSKRVLVGYNNKDSKAISGVIGAKAIHQQTQQERKEVLPIDQLYIDIGAKDKAEAEKLAPSGTMVTFDTDYTPFGDGLVLSKAFDDRVGIYNLLNLLDIDYSGTITFAFTCQEEVGCRGAISAAARIQADIALILECTSANDLGDVPDSLKVCEVGKGVCVSFMDNASIGDSELFKSLQETAKNANISWQIKKFVSGGNDAGAIQRSGKGCKTVTLSVPCRYIHSPVSVCSLSDIKSQEQLVRKYIETL